MTVATQIVVAVHQAVEQIVSVASALDHNHFNGLKTADRRLDQVTAVRDVFDPSGPITAGASRRQHNEPTLFEFAKHPTAGHVLEQALVRAPVPKSAQFFGQPGAVPIGIFRHETANQTDITVCQLSSLDGHASAHGMNIQGKESRVQHYLSKIRKNWLRLKMRQSAVIWVYTL